MTAHGAGALAADRRAVLSLLLDRGYSYEEVASRLGITRGDVAARARAAVAQLGPRGLPLPDPPGQDRFADYLLGQLSEAAAAAVRQEAERSDALRTWARAVTEELTNLGLPAAAQISAPDATAPVSRVGGAILLAAMALAVAAVLVVILRSGSGSGGGGSSAVVSPRAGSASAPAGTPASAPGYRVLATAALRPSGAGAAALGVSELVASGSQRALVIAARGLAPSSGLTGGGFAYDLWLSGRSRVVLIGRAQRVGADGRLGVLGVLPLNRAPFTTVLVTRERTATPTSPGTVLLSGPLPSG